MPLPIEQIEQIAAVLARYLTRDEVLRTFEQLKATGAYAGNDSFRVTVDLLVREAEQRT